MTREEIKKAMRDTKKEVAIKNLRKLLSLVEGYPEYEDSISYSIAKLEQVPILDTIKAEIEKEADTSNRLQGISEIGLRKALKIIDKYKAESKPQESEEL
jgi:hypothetical protein